MSKELEAASTEPLILALLSRGECHGYAIVQDIRSRAREEIRWADGMIYPVLHRLERDGCIQSRWVEIENGRTRKVYFIKPGGRKALEPRLEEGMAVYRGLTSYGGTAHV